MALTSGPPKGTSNVHPWISDSGLGGLETIHPYCLQATHWGAHRDGSPRNSYCGNEGELASWTKPLPLRPQVLFPRPLPWVGPPVLNPEDCPAPPQSPWHRLVPSLRSPAATREIFPTPLGAFTPLHSHSRLSPCNRCGRQPHLPGLSGASDAVLASSPRGWDDFSSPPAPYTCSVFCGCSLLDAGVPPGSVLLRPRLPPRHGGGKDSGHEGDGGRDDGE